MINLSKLFYKLLGRPKKYAIRGNELFNNSEYNEALNFYKKALEIEKNEELLEKINSIKTIGQIYALIKELEKSKDYSMIISNCNEILKINPHDQKIQSLKKKCEKTESEILKLLNDGKELFKHGEYSVSKECFKKIFEIIPKYDEANKFLSDLETIVSMHDQIKLDFKNSEYGSIQLKSEKIFSLNPEDNLTKDVIKKTEQILELLQKIKNLIEINSEDSSYELYEELINICNEVITLNPNDKFVSENLITFKKECLEILKMDYHELVQSFEYNLAFEKLKKAKSLGYHSQEVNLEFEKITKIINLIRSASEFFEKKEFNAALLSYEKLNRVVPNDSKFLDKINEIKNYLEHISKLKHEADLLLSKKEYSNAFEIYFELKNLNPKDNEINQTYSRLNEYFSQLSKGDHELTYEHYENALENYKKAHSLFESSDLTVKIQNVEKELFNKYLLNGDRAFEKGNYELAIEWYSKSKELIKNEYINQKIIEATNELFNKHCTFAERAYDCKDYQNAITSYKNAYNLKKSEKIAKKIDEITKIMNASKSAEESYKNGNYEKALQNYHIIKQLNSELCTGEIEKIEKIRSYLIKGDSQYSQKNYFESLPYYKKVLSINPLDKNVESKIKTIEKISELLKRGNLEFESKNYDLASKFYKEYISYVSDPEVLDRLHLISITNESNYYKILGLNESSSKGVIKKAYVTLSRKYVPAKYPDIQVKIRKAYDTLSNDVSREEYDIILKYGTVIEENIKSAKNSIESQRYSDAKKALTKILAVHPKHFEALDLIMVCALNLREYDELLKYASKFKERGDYESLIRAGRCYRIYSKEINSNYGINAEDCLKDAINIKDNPHEAYSELLDYYIGVSSFQKAKNCIEDIIKLKKGIEHLTPDIVTQMVVIGVLGHEWYSAKEFINRWSKTQNESNKKVLSDSIIEHAKALADARAHGIAADCLELAYSLDSDKHGLKEICSNFRTIDNAYSELNLLQNDNGILQELRIIMGVLLGNSTGEQINNADTIIRNCLNSLDHINRNYISDSIYRIENRYPNISKINIDFLNELKKVVRGW
ncbi:heat shock protein DnaJ domain protein [Methanococcus vannielii SB]|uniref:Heat shock protein DnaJ domain protein n=1 Tax=Methanococcus vannielii (strain ATCC 35089 / DSM 1224 / JCM 13029 / OCM 148 / SB) TaxID=406327 RepID=A6UND3_METVS|nr:DnaJ domain-containing protein [Methanococcus vannielii]ABR54005.1 heat shock protein DnaJ domain protein [Methanococcus vannielii SB]